MSLGAAGQEPEVGDEEFLQTTRDQAHARALRKQLQQLAGGGAGNVLQEMSREILSGRVGLREALRVPAYSEALGERARAFRQAWEQMSPEERERHTAEAQEFLAAQQEEIAAERGAAGFSRASTHWGDHKLGSGVATDALDGAGAGSASSDGGDTIEDLHDREQLDASQLAFEAGDGRLTSRGSTVVHRAVDDRLSSGTHEDAADAAANVPIGFQLGAGGNSSGDIDAAVNDDPRAAKEEEVGSAATALRDASGANGQRERPDPQRYGAFG